MEQACSIGYRASVGLASVGVVYLIVVAVGVVEAGFEVPILDPTLAVMEVLTMTSALLVVTLTAAVCAYASPARRVYALIALAFAVIMAGLTNGVHFFALTAGRQSGWTALEWPSALYAVELLAWDVFLGLCLLSMACVFPGVSRRATVRRSLFITGCLCLLGAIGPIIGDMTVQRIGILGYGVALPIASLVLARFFQGERALAREQGAQ